jgi:hypothetical protein
VITYAPNFPKGQAFCGYRNRIWQSEDMEGIRVIRVWSYVTRNEGFTKCILDYLSFRAPLFSRRCSSAASTSSCELRRSSSPHVPSGSASLHLRLAIVQEAILHQKLPRTTQWGPVTSHYDEALTLLKSQPQICEISTDREQMNKKLTLKSSHV